MQPLTLLAFSGAFLRASFAFHIPEGALNGVYSVRTYDNGTEEHTRIGNLVAPTTRSSLARGRRSIHRRYYFFDSSCFPDEGTEDLDHGDTDTVNSSVQNQCGGGASIGYGLDFYALSNCVVGYACNFNGGGPVSCSAAESVAANQQTTNTCGAYKPGSTEDEGLDVAYGYESYCTSKGHNFCGRGA